MNRIIQNHRGKLACGLAGVAVAICVLMVAYQRPAHADNGPVAEIRQLASVFGSHRVDVYLDADCSEPGQSFVKSGRIVGTSNVLGKKYLKVQKEGSVTLIELDRVAAFVVRK